MYNEIPKRVTELRKKYFKSAQAFADALCVSLKTVQGWEKKENPKLPTLENLIAICDLFGFDLDYFTGRLEQPTHDIQFIHEKTGLTVEAIRKLISNKEAVMDSPLSDIIVHDHAERLLRVLVLAADEDEISWLDLDNLPRGLLSSYADKPLDFSTGIGSEVADFLTSQEMISIIREIREMKEKNSRGKYDYNLYREKETRKIALGNLEDAGTDLYDTVEWVSDNEDEVGHNDEEKKEILNKLGKIQTLMNKIQIASYAEWKRGHLQKEFEEIMGRGNNGEH